MESVATAASRRNIVLLSDGTGNSAGKLFKTNVWRMYDALDLSNASQIASYDDGVGTSSIKPLAVFGGAVGWGLKRNVLSLYTFLCLNYRPGDRIYAFGFSRGAFTIRILINFILSQGLVADATSSDDLRRKALRLYRKFRVEKTEYYGLHSLARPLRDSLVFLRDVIRGQYREMRNIETLQVEEIAFLGLWDTVDAYGLPIAELGKGVDQWIWPLSLGDKDLDPKIKKACHALAIDDKRTTFHPLLWDESKATACRHTDEERLTQVWFAGAHANVGGGYPDDSLAFVPLRWMIGEAARAGVRFNALAVAAVDVKVSPYGRIYNPRAGLGAYYRYDPRRLDPPRDRQGACIPNPKVHETVVWRMAMGTDAYAPLSLPNGIRVVTGSRRTADDGEPNAPNILTFEEYRAAVCEQGDLYGAPAGDDAAAEDRKRAAADFAALTIPDEKMLELIWDTVWWRRIAYFTTLISTAILVLIPALLDVTDPVTDDNPIARSAGLASGLLPGMAHPWIEAFQAHTYEVGALILTTAGFALWGALLDRRIHDRAVAAWTGRGKVNRFRSFRESLRGRYVTAGIIVVPGGLLLLLMFYGIATSTGFGQGIAIIFAVLIFILTAPFAIWWFVLWRVSKRGLESQTEVRGPALWLANRLRTWRITAWPYRFFAQSILPTAFAVFLVAMSIYGLSRVSFDFMSSGGWICSGGARVPDIPKDGKIITLSSTTGCMAADIELKAKVAYDIAVRQPIKWEDNGVTVPERGASTYRIGWHKYLQLPLRRQLTAQWFTVIARVGDRGSEEYVLKAFETTRITPSRTGQLYLFVNEAVLGLPDYDDFYKDNNGTAEIAVFRAIEAR